MPRKITIVKTEIVTPVDKDTNDFGDILFHDNVGNEYKINQKRARLGEQIVVGRAVELGYGNYMNYDFIAEARLVEGALPPAKEPYTPPPEEKPKPTAYAKLNPELPKTISGQEIGRCWNAIDTLFIGGKLPTLFGKENAEAILKYYRGILTSTLKLPVDGKKLPQWDKTAKGE